MDHINIIVIALIIIGIIFIVLSFIVKDKNSIKDTNTKDKLIQDFNFINQNHNKIDSDKEEMMKEISNKILELNDYSSFIKKELNDKHKELLFLYQLISEKEKNIKKLSTLNNNIMEEKEEIIKIEDEIIDSNDKTIEKNNKVIENNYPINSQNIENKNQEVIELYNEGYSITDIAKIMSLGKGEVKLILEFGVTRDK